MKRTVAVFGASGYVGSRLVPRLVADGNRVRCFSRDPDRLQARLPESNAVSHVKADLANLGPSAASLEDCDSAYYLVHAMESGPEFAAADRHAASNFLQAAERAGISRVIYLGALADPSDRLSPHLRSRHEVAAILRSGRPCLTELQASIVIGPDSVPLRILTDIVTRLPFLIAPESLRTRLQPIFVDDLVTCLVYALRPEATGRTVQLGGPDVTTYRALLDRVAIAMKLRAPVTCTLLLPIPRPGPWTRLLTGVPSSVAGPLLQGIRCEMTVREDTALDLLGYSPHTRLSDALSLSLAQEAR